MTVIRNKPSGRFAALPNAIWEDDGLSVEAKGTLGYVLSRPPNWHISLRQIGKKLKVGKDRLQRIVREWIAAGYCEREQLRRRDGSFGRWEYVVHDVPKATVAIPPQPEKPEAAQPAPAEPALANQAAHINKTESNNTESTKPLSPTPFPNSAPPLPLRQQGLGDGRSNLEHQSILQARVARRLGEGDAQKGFLMLGALSDVKCDELTEQERSGHLSDAALDKIRLNLKLSFLSGAAPDEPAKATDEEWSEFSRAARRAGCHPVIEGSKPFQMWKAFRGEDGMPPIVIEMFAGKPRRIVWLPSLYPPGQRDSEPRELSR